MLRHVMIWMILFSAIKTPAQNFRLSFVHQAGDSILKQNRTYYNSFGQSFSLTKFKYYISDIVLATADGETQKFSPSFLIDDNEEDSKQIVLPVLIQKKFISLEFIVGVDSIHNCSGIQEGSLDPLNGMFWTWNSGYIYLKLEGYSAASPLPRNLIEYHIGGYMQHNAIRKVKINLPSLSSATLKVDILSLFNSVHKIDFIKTPSITTPAYSMLMADNFSSLFTLVQL